MSFQIRKAERQNIKLKIGFFGPSGSGKTMSALKFAKGLVGNWESICVLDTENGSAGLYSHLGPFLHCEFEPPFSPDRYLKAIQAVKEHGGIKCLIIDSISHEWEGEGGCLQIHTALGGKFQDWGRVTPMHNKFVQGILQAPFHVLVAGRSKIDYAMDKNDKGRTSVQKVGLKHVTREGFDYELTLSFAIQQNHYAEIDKDRTNIFHDRPPFMIDESIGKVVSDWNQSGSQDHFLYESIIGIIREKTFGFKLKDRLAELLESIGLTSSDEIRHSPTPKKKEMLQILQNDLAAENRLRESIEGLGVGQETGNGI